MSVTRDGRCRCCRAWVMNCVCFGGYMTGRGAFGCTPKDHGYDDYLLPNAEARHD